MALAAVREAPNAAAHCVPQKHGLEIARHTISARADLTRASAFKAHAKHAIEPLPCFGSFALREVPDSVFHACRAFDR
jgi:hypothetical protein